MSNGRVFVTFLSIAAVEHFTNALLKKGIGVYPFENSNSCFTQNENGPVLARFNTTSIHDGSSCSNIIQDILDTSPYTYLSMIFTCDNLTWSKVGPPIVSNKAQITNKETIFKFIKSSSSKANRRHCGRRRG